jgi:ATP-binding cassette, subfamily B, bacterial
MRIANVTGGELLINDINVDRYDPTILRKHISVLFQDVGQFSGLTIGENIGLGQVECPEAIKQSAEEAGASEFIENFKFKYDSYLGRIPGWWTYKEGQDSWDDDSDSDDEDDDEDDEDEKKEQKKRVQKDLSGGQWQKLGLARAFMRRNHADLMVLDEPTAKLDPEAEFKLFETIKKTRAGRTTIYISHRFNTVKLADQIMVMEKGDVKEFGTHEELMKIKDGKYRRLYSLQAMGFELDDKDVVSKDGVIVDLQEGVVESILKSE